MMDERLLWTVTLTFFLFFGFLDSKTAQAFPADDDDTFQADGDAKNKSVPVVLKQNETYVVTEGETLRMPCNIEFVDWAALWYKGTENDSLLYVQDAAHYQVPNTYSFEKEKSTLVIKHVNETTAGLYTCMVLPQVKTTHTVRIKVSVEIGHVSKNMEVGGNLVLSCKVNGYPKPKLEWFRKKSSGSFQTELIGSSAEITIPNVNVTDSGTYICSASNAVGDNASASIVIKVVNGLSAESSVVFVDVKENKATMCCIYHKMNSGSPNSIHWLKDGIEVQLTSRITTELHQKVKQCLVIKKVTEQDLAEYTCRIMKSKGAEKASTKLTGAPQVPTLEKVTVDSTKNSTSSVPLLRWRVGTFSPLTSYEIFVRKQEDTEWQLYVNETVLSSDQEEVIEQKFDQLSNGQYATKLVVHSKYGSSELLTEDMPLIIDIRAPVGGNNEAGRNYAGVGVLVTTILTTLLLRR